MPTLQVRDLPEDIYNQLQFLAKQEHRSLAQETIVLLREGVSTKLSNQSKRHALLEKLATQNNQNTTILPSPVDLVREDRER